MAMGDDYHLIMFGGRLHLYGLPACAAILALWALPAIVVFLVMWGLR